MTDTKTGELGKVVNAPEMITAFGRTYEIKRFTLGPLTQAFEYVGPLGFILKRILALPRDEQGKPQFTPEDGLDLAITAISIGGASVMGLISVATKEPSEWLEEQDPMDGLKIFAKVVEKNLDFFTPAYIDKMREMFGALMDRIPTLGGDASTT